MKIAKVELFHVQIPCPKPFWPTWIPGYPQTHNGFTLIRLTTKCGIEGWSAGSAMGKEREGLGDLIGGYLIGLDPEDIDTVNQRLKEASYLGWRNYWIEPAFWDIIGKSKGKPVYELLGGTPRKVDVYCSTGEMHEPERRVDELLSKAELGFKTAKLRVKNMRLEDDIRHVQVVGKGVEGILKMGVDANQAWLVTIVDKIPAWDLKRATEFAHAAADSGFEWLEEPLDLRDYDGLAALRKVARLKIAGAELNYGWQEIKVMIEKGSYDVYQPDATFCGISDALKTMKACKESGGDLSYTPHTWTNGVGFIINHHMLLADPDNNLPLEYPLDEPGWVPEARDGILRKYIMPDKNGQVDPPTAPGLGIDIHPGRLRKYGKRFFKMDKLGLTIKVIMEKGLKTALELKERKGD